MSSSTARSRLRELDEDAPAIGVVADPAHEPVLLESVDERRDRAGAQPGRGRELPGGHRTPLLEDVEAPSVAAVDAEVIDDRFVQVVRGPLVRAVGRERLPAQLVPAVVRHSGPVTER